jgi:phospholipase D1/2
MNRRNAIKLAMLAVLVGGVIALYFSPLRAYLTKSHLNDLIAWLRGLWYGPIVLIALYAVGCVFAIPASVFVLAAGVIWGWKLGSLYAITGGMLGAVASYYVGGFLGEGLLEKFGSAGHAVRRQVENAGFTSMLIVRLIPGPPFAVWNYAAGIARMRFRDYFWATLIGVVPSHIVFTYCADSLVNGTMTQGDALKRLAIVCALMLALIAIPLVIKKRLGAKVLPPP